MCNLYDIGPGRKRPRTLFEAAALEVLPQLPRLFGIRKTDTGVAVRRTPDGYVGEPMRWGFRRDFNPAINNTRDDKLDGGMWRKAFAERRCLIPLAAFYEWTGPKGAKQTHVFQSAEPADWLWCPGIWEMSREAGPCYSMITTESPPWMAHIHNRVIALFDDLGDAAAYLEAEDPKPLVRAPGPLPVARCENPLRAKTPGPPVLL